MTTDHMYSARSDKTPLTPEQVTQRYQAARQELEARYFHPNHLGFDDKYYFELVKDRNTPNYVIKRFSSEAASQEVVGHIAELMSQVLCGTEGDTPLRYQYKPQNSSKFLDETEFSIYLSPQQVETFCRRFEFNPTRQQMCNPNCTIDGVAGCGKALEAIDRARETGERQH